MNRAGRFTPRDTIVLHPYGHYSNAFKFAGEVDVLEALNMPGDTTGLMRIALQWGFPWVGQGAAWQSIILICSSPRILGRFFRDPGVPPLFSKETLAPTDFEHNYGDVAIPDTLITFSNYQWLPTAAS